MRLVFWQNMMAIHQSAHIRALAARPDLDVTWVVEEAITPDRVEQGWPVPDAGKAMIVVNPGDAEMDALLHEAPDNSVHVFTGIRPYPMVWRAYKKSRSLKTRRGLLVEGGDHRGAKGKLRRALGISDFVRFGKEIDFVMAMGEMGVRWFRGCGWPEGKVFEYGYWVENPALPDIAELDKNPAGPVRLMYLGQFIPRKSVDLLLTALAGVDSTNWTLTLMGNGPQEQELKELAAQLGIAERLGFAPPRPNAEAVAAIARHDLYILPSGFDGWGATTNEALMCGVPVVCSDNCGSGSLLRASWRGETFRAASADSLRDVLARRIAAGRLTPETRERIRSWSCAIEGRTGAEYFWACMEASAGKRPRPVPPWLA